MRNIVGNMLETEMNASSDKPCNILTATVTQPSLLPQQPSQPPQQLWHNHHYYHSKTSTTTTTTPRGAVRHYSRSQVYFLRNFNSNSGVRKLKTPHSDPDLWKTWTPTPTLGPNSDFDSDLRTTVWHTHSVIKYHWQEIQNSSKKVHKCTLEAATG